MFNTVACRIAPLTGMIATSPEPTPSHTMAYEARTVLSTLSQILEDSALSSSNLNDGLAFMRLYARLNWDNISGHFGNDELELAFWEKWRDRDLGKSSLSFGMALNHDTRPVRMFNRATIPGLENKACTNYGY